MLPDHCRAGSRWEPGQPAFRLVDWGFEALGVTGIRLSVVDYDDDGWPDLVSRQVGDQEAAMTSKPGKPVVWLLHNVNGRFEDVTQASGLFTRRDQDATRSRPAELVIFADVNGDGNVDAFTAGGASGGSVETPEILLGDGKGGFQLGPVDSPLRELWRNGDILGASFLDAGQDGRLDLFVGSSGQDHLLQGLGDGGFVDITKSAGLITVARGDPTTANAGLAHTIAWSTVACDLNDDGRPELLSSSYGRGPNHLWVADLGPEGSTHYQNRSVASGYAYDAGQDWSDNESARCHCKLHPQDEGCAGVPAPAAISCTQDSDAFRWNHASDREAYRLGGNSGTTVCADLDGDLKLDLVTTEIAHWDVGSSSDRSELLRNTGETPLRFSRPGRSTTGLSRTHPRYGWNEGDMTAAAFDFDNDGALDLYLGDTDYPDTRGLLYHQDSPGHFGAVPPELGIDQLRSHGIAVADFDRDGDLDVIVGHSRSRCGGQCYPSFALRAFENLVGHNGNWLQLSLRDPSQNNSRAVGARVVVRGTTADQLRTVGGGYGQAGMQQDPVLQFGLGTDCLVEVEVRWPGPGSREDHFLLPAGYRFHLEPGAAATAL